LTAGRVPSTGLDIAAPCGLAFGAVSAASYTVSPAGRIDARDAFDVQHAAGHLITSVRYVMVLQRASAGPACDEVVHYYTTEQ
jgi:hypothetical protein